MAAKSNGYSSTLVYLGELKRRCLLSLLWLFSLFALLSFFANPLYQILAQPLIKQLPNSHLIATDITASFLVPLKFVFMVSLALSIPIFFYHLWSFISPALYPHERKIIWRLLVPSVLLFYGGIILGYCFILPLILRFFATTVPHQVELLPDMGHYLSFAVQMLFAFGLVFEVPILVWVLIDFNLISPQSLIEMRRYVIVLAFIIAMLITPPDVLSQTLLAITLWLLYECGLFLAIFQRRKKDKIKKIQL